MHRPHSGAPRKRFGQNFLTDAGVVARIMQTIRAQPDDVVVEIDRDFAAQWRARENERLTVHEGDALDFDFAVLAGNGAKLRVVGNLPYNISTPLLFHLLAQGEVIRDMHFMLQREVVERLGAAPGGADYGRLSVMVQYQCRVQPLLAVPTESFYPPPRVHSAVVRLVPGYFDHGVCVAPAMLRQLVGQAFTQRRKTLRNALAGLLDVGTMEALVIDPRRRPETLSVAEFVRLADAASALSAAPLPCAGEGLGERADHDGEENS